MKIVERKYPMTSDMSSTNMIRVFTGNISLSKNQTLGNLLAALMVRQKPKLQKKVPTRK